MLHQRCNNLALLVQHGNTDSVLQQQQLLTMREGESL